MSKHTAGPWRVGTPGPNGCYTVGTERGLMVAMVAHSANQPDQCEQAIGDARLIAAAPENYACNVELAKIVRELCAAYNHPLPQASLDRSDAAIAKAEAV